MHQRCLVGVTVCVNPGTYIYFHPVCGTYPYISRFEPIDCVCARAAHEARNLTHHVGDRLEHSHQRLPDTRQTELMSCVHLCEAQGAVAPQDWVAGVALEPNALSYIAQLYALLDRNGDGVLTVADFTMDGFSLQKNNAWVKVQQFFDSDKDGGLCCRASHMPRAPTACWRMLLCATC
eukprot:m.1131180 g.1131180  ORF g.1131180 m.1131180 type:complete len:178 (+) comp24424_c3_seq23:114-647(+)